LSLVETLISQSFGHRAKSEFIEDLSRDENEIIQIISSGLDEKTMNRVKHKYAVEHNIY